jgi:Carboxypeptidase regulatory-like domain
MPSYRTARSSHRKQWAHKTSIAALWVLLELGCAISCPPARPQTAGTGALDGVVSDPSGAVLVGAQIKATSDTRGELRTVKSGTNGSYLLALLLPGVYEVEVIESGFKTAHFLHVRIAVAETTTLNVRLEIGAVSEQITVQGGAEQLQTESSTLGRVTDGEQIRTLPLVTRNCSQIIALNPGVAAEVTDAGHSVRDSAGPRVQDSFRMGAPSWTIISR